MKTAHSTTVGLVAIASLLTTSSASWLPSWYVRRDTAVPPTYAANTAAAVPVAYGSQAPAAAASPSAYAPAPTPSVYAPETTSVVVKPQSSSAVLAQSPSAYGSDAPVPTSSILASVKPAKSSQALASSYPSQYGDTTSSKEAKTSEKAVSTPSLYSVPSSHTEVAKPTTKPKVHTIVHSTTDSAGSVNWKTVVSTDDCTTSTAPVATSSAIAIPVHTPKPAPPDSYSSKPSSPDQYSSAPVADSSTTVHATSKSYVTETLFSTVTVPGSNGKSPTTSTIKILTTITIAGQTYTTQLPGSKPTGSGSSPDTYSQSAPAPATPSSSEAPVAPAPVPAPSKSQANEAPAAPTSYGPPPSYSGPVSPPAAIPSSTSAPAVAAPAPYPSSAAPALPVGTGVGGGGNGGGTVVPPPTQGAAVNVNMNGARVGLVVAGALAVGFLL